MSVGEAINQNTVSIGGLLLLVTFRRWFLLPSLFIQLESLNSKSLPLGRTLLIERPGIAIDAQVLEILESLLVWNFTILIHIIAFCVLPGIAFLATDGTLILNGETTEAFDGVILLFRRRG